MDNQQAQAVIDHLDAVFEAAQTADAVLNVMAAAGLSADDARKVVDVLTTDAAYVAPLHDTHEWANVEQTGLEAFQWDVRHYGGDIAFDNLRWMLTH